jgi:parallel beta-helix repeat protein
MAGSDQSRNKMRLLGVRPLVLGTALLAVVFAGSTVLPVGNAAGATTTVAAADAFSRTLSSGWGKAPTGGAYTVSTKSAALSVGSGNGVQILRKRGAKATAALRNVSLRDVDISFRVKTNKRATGKGQFVTVVARRVKAGSEYRVRVRFARDGSVWAKVIRRVNGVRRVVGSEVRLSGVVHKPTSYLRLRVQVVGTDPSQIAIKAWPAGQSQPSGWSRTFTDNAAALRASGSIALHSNLARNATNAPVRFVYDDLQVATADVAFASKPKSEPTSTPAPAGVYAQDTFRRSVTSGWGKADVGGSYSVSGAVSDYSVTDTAARMRLSKAGVMRSALLTSVSRRDVDTQVSFKLDKLPSQGSVWFYAVVRHSADNTEYRAKVRIRQDGTVFVSASKVLSGTEVAIGSEVALPAVYKAGAVWTLHARFTGTSPTKIGVRAWPSSASEPGAWQYSSSDNSGSLQSAGSAGIRAYSSKGATNAPFTVTLKDYAVTASGDQPPTPSVDSPSPTPTASPTAPPTVSPSPSPSPTPSASPSPSPSPSPTASPSPSPSPTPSASPSPSPSPSPTASPSPSPSPTPSASPSPSPSPSPTASPSPSPSPTPSASPSPSPTASPTPSPTPAPTNAYYVSTTGSDTNAGTQAAPWRTLQKAANTVPAGATVLARGGTYAGFTMTRSGTASARITFTAYPGETAVVDGKGLVSYTIRLASVKYVNITGLTVQGGFAEKHHGGGIMVENSSNVEVRNNLVRENKAFGVRSQTSTYVTIDNNEITKNAVGVHIGNAGEGTYVTNNRIFNNDKMMVNTPDIKSDDAGAEGVAIVKTTGKVIVSGNLIWGNRAKSYDYGYDGGAFSIYAASNWHIRDNITWDSRNVLETGSDANKTPCDNNSFTRNINYGATTEDRTVGMVLRCASNTLVANNTFHDIQYFVFDISHNKGGWGASIEGLQVVNNVVWVSTGKVYGIETDPLPSSVVIDHNLVYNSGTGYLATVVGRGGTKDLATFRSWTGREAKGIQADPRFVDAAKRDYRLRADSPAVDTGRIVSGVTNGFTGAAPDRGALERN